MSTLRFGTTSEPNLEKLSSMAFGHLESSEWNYNGFSFLPKEPFIATPDKKYQAKAIAEATHPAAGPLPFGKLIMLAFAKNDGTGNDIDYQLPGLEPHHTPRKKPEGGFEIVIPIGTVYGETWIGGLVDLQELSFEVTGTHSGNLHITNLGTSPEYYQKALRAVEEHRIRLIEARSYAADFTQDSANGFGNAHAIWAPYGSTPKRVADGTCSLRIAGFLSLPSDSPALIKAARELTEKPALAHTVSYKP